MTLKDLSIFKWHKDCEKTSMPPDYVPKDKFTDKTANGLTKAIVTFINLAGGQAERISSMGRVIDGRKVVTNVLGQTGLIGSQTYIKGTSTNGTADISAIIKSKKGSIIPWKIEVKMKDKQSKAQKEYEQSVIKAGGEYSIVHNWDEFISKYIWLLENK
jgi:hypothetical protein